MTESERNEERPCPECDGAGGYNELYETAWTECDICCGKGWIRAYR